MKQISWLISKYLVRAILPYFVFSWLLLSVILFVQQASRFSDIFFSVNIPANLVWQLTVALIPNVIAFTCPMAVLVGTIIGLSKMQGDSELVAIRAAGVGNLQIAVPIIVLGIALSIFAFVVNLKGVPLAASLVRNVALQSAIQKLESPIEPGVFNTEIAGYTIYVKGGDISTGRWNNIFIYTEDSANGVVRLITSSKGRIDTTDQVSELVLENASVSTFPKLPGAGKYVSENIGEVRLAIKTKRSELIEKLGNPQGAPEELGLSELSDFAESKEGKDRVEAQILLQRRIILSISPLIFCLLGTAMILRFNRGGRGFGAFLALASLIGYYLFAFLGEQLTRTGRIPVLIGGLLPILASIIAIAWFSASSRVEFVAGWGESLVNFWASLRRPRERVQTRNLFVDLTTGLRDFDLITNLAKYFFLTLGFLTAVFVIFTAFELWKFAGAIDGGVFLLAKYLFFLLPFVYLQISPSAAMVATLATYVIKSRQNEIVTWTSAGQSVYRLLVPCFLLMIGLGLFNWEIQERFAPRSNQLQDSTRTQIRRGGTVTNTSGKYWVANDKRIYSFELDVPPTSASDNETPFYPEDRSGREVVMSRGSDPVAVASGLGAAGGVASDNEWLFAESVPPDEIEVRRMFLRGTVTAGSRLEQGIASDNQKQSAIGLGSNMGGGVPLSLIAPSPLMLAALASDNEKTAPCPSVCVRNLTVYEFADGQAKLQTVYRTPAASWTGDRIVFNGPVEKSDLREGKISTETLNGGELAEADDPFAGLGGKPSHMTVSEIRREIAGSESEVERRSFAVALEKRYSTLLLPLVIALFTAPFALSLHRSGRVVTIGYAIGLWLLYTGVTNLFEQFGQSGFLTPAFAVYSPILIFSMLGVYLLSKVRT
jgi:lipopolysaccharide export LptBFGC system permease protein LptF